MGRRVSVSLAFALLAALVVVAGAGPVGATSAPPAPRWPAHPDWQRDVVTPTRADVSPVRIVRTSGPVSGARTLVTGSGGGDATLTSDPGRPPPTIVLDYGQDVGGIPYVVVRSESRSPVLRSTYSEGLHFLGSMGDGAIGSTGAGDVSRVDDVTVSSTGRFTRGLIQGGERYERITLASPGRVTLSSVGIHFTAVRATAKSFKGWFDSSSPALNRIWYDGAYTTQLDELSARALPSPWHITSGDLETDGGNFGILRQGVDWTDYTMSFETQIVDNGAGWMVRAPSSSSGYLFYLGDATDTAGTPDSLREIAFGPDKYVTLGDVRLPGTVVDGRWYQVKTVVSGREITTSIDGRPVAAFNTGTLPVGAPDYRSGSVGFAAPGTDALFRDLRVAGPGRTTLFADLLSRPAVLADFDNPDLGAPDPLPVIMDGAKRDRVVWSGDLGVEGPNVFDTTAAYAFVRGSLTLLGSYQDADGESGSDVPPAMAIGTFPEIGYTYSASYSMDEVDNIATYYLYTGDLAFVRAEWPMIKRELAYNASLVDSRGLLATDAANGLDWDYYDGPKTGEVSAYNDIYYRTLLDAATMADALGSSDEANSDRLMAAHLRTAINRYLVDPTTGLYVVSNLEPGTVAQDATSLAVLFGVAPADHDATIMTRLAKTLPTTPYGPLPFSDNTGYRRAISPFVTSDELQGLFDAGETAAATSLLETVWGHMDATGPNDTGTDWELVAADGSPGFGAYTSLAHGWASGATPDLSSYILGVQPVTAGYAIWTVHPHPGSLLWAEGDVPTPRGTIDVRWAQSRGARFALEVSGPARTQGVIVVPVASIGATATVTSAGPGRNQRSRRVLTTTAGTSQLSIAISGGTTDEVEITPR
ncbi:MAG TPA: alpha-L-rhamnosidase C-terminal domain-containing protein [Acidimicrobiales bacterium]